MPLRFIHTADWHLGHTYWKIGARAAQSREWRFEAVRRIWELAAAQNADFILVAGDVFDSDTPSPAIRQGAIELLADAPAPVYLISGNHDPNAEGSIWQNADFRGSVQNLPNVRLALQTEPLEIEGDALLFPCPVSRKYSRADATHWIPEGARGETFRVGLAHGRWRGYFGGDDGPLDCISSDCAQRAGLDYLALGDYHSFTPADHAAAKARSFYAGTPEIGARDNVRGGHALCVEIGEPGHEVRVEAHKTGKIELHDLGNFTLSSGDDFERLKSRAEEISAPENAILRAKVSGDVSPSLLREINDWLADARDELLGVDLSLQELRTRPTREDFAKLRLERIEESLVETLGNAFDADYLEGIKGAPTLENWSGDEDARREALTLYYRWLGG